MKKKIVAIMLSSAVAGTFFAGCGDGKAGNNGKDAMFEAVNQVAEMEAYEYEMSFDMNADGEAIQGKLNGKVNGKDMTVGMEVTYDDVTINAQDLVVFKDNSLYFNIAEIGNALQGTEYASYLGLLGNVDWIQIETGVDTTEIEGMQEIQDLFEKVAKDSLEADKISEKDGVYSYELSTPDDFAVLVKNFVSAVKENEDEIKSCVNTYFKNTYDMTQTMSTTIVTQVLNGMGAAYEEAGYGDQVGDLDAQIEEIKAQMEETFTQAQTQAEENLDSTLADITSLEDSDIEAYKDGMKNVSVKYEVSSTGKKNSRVVTEKAALSANEEDTEVSLNFNATITEKNVSVETTGDVQKLEDISKTIANLLISLQ